MVAIVGAVSLAGACGSQATPGARPAIEVASQASPGIQKTLRMALDYEPKDFLLPARRGTSGGEALVLADAQLTVLDGTGTLAPRTAAEIPTIANGGWRV